MFRLTSAELHFLITAALVSALFGTCGAQTPVDSSSASGSSTVAAGFR